MSALHEQAPEIAGASKLVRLWSGFKRVWFGFLGYLRRLHWGPGVLAPTLFCALLLVSLVYRAALYGRLYLTGASRFQFTLDKYPLVSSLANLWDDVMLLALLSGLVWLLGRGAQLVWRKRGAVPRALGLTGVALVHLLFLVVLFGYIGHFGLLFSVHTGLTYETIIESYFGQGILGLFGMISLGQLLLLSLPLALLWLLMWPSARFQRWRNRLAIWVTVFFCLLQLLQLHQQPVMAAALRRNPLLFTLSDTVRSMYNERRARKEQFGINRFRSWSPPPRPSAARRIARHAVKPSASTRRAPGPDRLAVVSRRQPPGTHVMRQRRPQIWTRLSKAQQRSLQWISPALVDAPPVKKRPIQPRKDWNIVLIILESTGFRYVFDTSLGNPVPMPFLKRVAQDSWFLQRHFSPSNSTPRSVFSIFSGLFPIPQVYFFSTLPKNSVPSLVTLLGKRYDAFLTNPSPLRWYFPRHFLKNSGLSQLFGYYGLPLKRHGPGKAWARDERETTSFFLQRLQRAREPFFATMCSFIPHWPYTDYGPDYRILPDTKRWQHRYYNNLRLLDLQIQRVFDALRTQGRLHRTIVVMVGDHGEAFGQHLGNWTHSRFSYNENYHVPALFYQPRLFKPRLFKRYTSHVDIVPTLLDAMGKPYNPVLLQGESLWKKKLRRRYIFLFGNENTLSSISRDGIKLQMSFKHRRCWVYDLKRDPNETQRLSCRGYREQMSATLLYRKFQTKVLHRYNDTRLKGRPFYGQTHPVE